MSQGYTRPFRAINRVTLATGVPTETNFSATVRSGNGTTITSGGVDTKGSYATLIASLNNAAYGLWVIGTTTVGASGTITGMLVDIAYNDGSDHIIVPNLNFGYSQFVATSIPPRFYTIPGLNIPAGSAIEARCQSTVNNDTISLGIFTKPNTRYDIANTVYTDYGTNVGSNSLGTSVPTGNGTFGAWTQIGTTTADHYLHIIGVDGQDTAQNTTDYVVEIGYGPNAGAVTSMGFTAGLSNGLEVMGSYHDGLIEYPTTSGTLLFARIASNAVDAFDITIHSL